MDTAPAAEEEPAPHCLWVDKFTPRRYMELLSDDVRVWAGRGRHLCDSSLTPWDRELPLEAWPGGCVRADPAWELSRVPASLGWQIFIGGCACSGRRNYGT